MQFLVTPNYTYNCLLLINNNANSISLLALQPATSAAPPRSAARPLTRPPLAWLRCMIGCDDEEAHLPLKKRKWTIHDIMHSWRLTANNTISIIGCSKRWLHIYIRRLYGYMKTINLYSSSCRTQIQLFRH